MSTSLNTKFATSSLTVALLLSGGVAALPAVSSASPVTSTQLKGSTTLVPESPSPTSPEANQGEQAGAIGRQIINWARSKGGAVWGGLTNAVSRGWVAVKDWIIRVTPRFLKDLAITVGLDLVAQWITNNLPF